MRDETADRWVVRDNGRFTDLHPCGEPNQYAIAADDRGLFMRLVPRDEWVESPRVCDVETLAFSGCRTPPLGVRIDNA